MAGNLVASVAVALVLNDRAFNNSVKNNIRATESAYTSAFKTIGTVIASAFAISKVIDFGKTAVNAASESQAAWTGLNSIVQGTGNDFNIAHNYLTQFTKDGLVSIENAATAYKNLLARGYDTTQIEGVMNALKDSAAFGRQSSYTLSQAIVTATEGLKNENSILVDNAGVTKNVAKMWDDYAESIGKTTNQLTQQEKIQAEVNGILEETKFQTGDAATYTQTFGGKVQVLKGAFASMKIAIGKVVAPIVGLFIPAITAAINTISAFFTKLQSVLKVFGLDFPDVVSKTTSSVGTATNTIIETGNAAANTAKDISGTGTAAKKAVKEVKRAFASVDEINVINTKDTSELSDSSSGSISGINDSYAVDTGNNAIDTAIKDTSDKIMKYIKPLQDIDFSNLVKAFDKVKNAVKAVGGTIWKGLEWAYFNILVPLSKWTIEDFLPEFLNLVSSELKVINPLLVSFGNVFKVVWDNVLKPIAQWTGGVIVSVLNGIGNALSSIGSWMSNNQKVVDVMVASLVTFFGVWKLTQLAAFIQMSGGLIAAFNLITGAIVKNTAAKIVDKSETIILTGLYAKDFVVAIAKGTAALVKQAAQWVATTAVKVAATAATVAGTVATTAATAATWLFNAALAVLTSPITLVIAAIAALIAIVYLLIKNWDVVKEVGKKCWEGIKSAWNAAGTWFNDKIVTPIANNFKNMWVNLNNGAKDAWTRIKNVFSNVGSFFGGIWNTIKIKFQDIGQKIGDAVGRAFKSSVNAVLRTIENVLNTPIRAINSLIGVINAVPGINLNKLKTFSLPRLAQGGWLKKNNPKLAVVGDNKREAEIVAPESKIREQVKQAINELGGNFGNKENMKFDFTIRMIGEDGRTIIKKINDVTIQDGQVSLII